MDTNTTPRRGFLGIIACCLLTATTFSPLFSCKKSSSDSSQSKTALATQAPWKVQSVGVDIDKNGSVDQDVTSYLQSCQTDNSYTLKSDGSGTIDEGATKCNSTDPQTSALTWTFKSNETIINGNFGVFNGDATITTLNTINFVVWKDTTYVGSPVRMYLTLKH